jgi:hypothetical protein
VYLSEIGRNKALGSIPNTKSKLKKKWNRPVEEELSILLQSESELWKSTI